MPKRKGQPRTNKGLWKIYSQAKRREAAEARNVVFNALTVQEKIAKLNRYGFKAKKERAKLVKLG